MGSSPGGLNRPAWEQARKALEGDRPAAREPKRAARVVKSIYKSPTGPKIVIKRKHKYPGAKPTSGFAPKGQ